MAGEQYQVWVDSNLCSGLGGLCQNIAPDVFRIPEDDHGLTMTSEVLTNGTGEFVGPDAVHVVSDDQLDCVIEAAQECPGDAICLEKRTGEVAVTLASRPE